MKCQTFVKFFLSEWPKMDFKHNFWKCNILLAGPPPPIVTFVTIFLFFIEGFPHSFTQVFWFMVMMCDM